MTSVVVAPDKFKGSLAATEVAGALAAGIRQQRQGVTVLERPVADGGEGTLDAFVAAGFTPVSSRAAGPWDLRRRPTKFAVHDGTAVVELAATIGPSRRGDALTANTFGYGELIRHALDLGCTQIVLAVGGSVSTDGGIGMVQALGAVLHGDRESAVLAGTGHLDGVARLDLSRMDPRLARTQFILAADVTNPLLGRRGAAAVFAPQKGATPAQVALLEQRLHRWSQLVGAATGTDKAGEPGAGAAGGTGFAALALLNARFRRGIDVVCELIDLDGTVAQAALVVTGEGCLDTQTIDGKGPLGVAEIACRHAVPVIAVAGIVRLDQKQTAAAGFRVAYALADLEPDPVRSITDAASLLRVIGSHIGERHLVHCAPCVDTASAGADVGRQAPRANTKE